MKPDWNKLSFFEKIFLYSRSYFKLRSYYISRLFFKHFKIFDGKTILKFINLGSKNYFRIKTFFEKEPETLKWIRSFNKDDVFWDIGANVGLYTIYAALKSNVTVYAFEPMPLNYKNLCMNISLNEISSKIIPCCLVLNNRSIFSYLYVKWLEEGFSGTSFNEPIKISKSKSLKIRQFGTSIDTLVYKLGFLCPTHLKIDVDGNDFLVLKGAKKVLKNKKLKSISIEVPIFLPSLEKKKTTIKKEKKDKIINKIKNYLENYKFSYFKTGTSGGDSIVLFFRRK